MNRTRQSHSVVDPETVAALLQRKNGSLRKLATNLGFPASYNATLSDILRDRPGAITLEGENILRRTLGLPVIQTRTARACPSCGAVHGEGLDCHSQPVASVALLRPGEQVRPTPRPRRPRRIAYRAISVPRQLWEKLESMKGRNETWADLLERLTVLAGLFDSV